MKNACFAFILLFSFNCFAQTHTIEKLWQTDSIVAVPESVLLDAKKGILYVSLIDGGGWDADGKGGVARLRTDGTGYDSLWITGLHAPKGMGIFKNKLYVADISNVVVIDINKGIIEKKIPIDSATGLNDITVSNKGIVYVSDSRKARIWKIKKGIPSLFLENMTGVNGLKAIKNDLVIASGKSFISANAKKQITKMAELPQGGDGIEPVGNGDYIVSSWPGYIWYVHKDGKIETLLETHLEKKNTADIGYDAAKRIIYVPTFFAKTVVAYKLN